MKKYLLLFLLLQTLGTCNQNTDNLVEFTGILEATQIDIRAEARGQILQIHFDEGAQVKPGNVLAEIDHEKLDYELKQAQARVKELEANLSLLQKGFRDAEIEKAKEFFLEAEIQLKESKRQYNRIQELFDREVVSVHQRDRAETALKSALKRYEMAKKDYQIFQEGYRKEEIVSTQAAKESAEAIVNLIKRKVLDATVVIPANGVINEIYVEPGELVSPGTLLAKVIDLQDIWIMAYVSENNLEKIQLGQTVKIFVDSYPNREFLGKVTSIYPEAEFTPPNIQNKEERAIPVYGVKIQIDNTDELLKLGMPADAIIELSYINYSTSAIKGEPPEKMKLVPKLEIESELQEETSIKKQMQDSAHKDKKVTVDEKAVFPEPFKKDQVMANSIASQSSDKKAQKPAVTDLPVDSGIYSLLLRSFQKRKTANSEMKIFQKKGYKTYVEPIDLGNKGIWYRVKVGKFKTKAEALKISEKIAKKEGFKPLLLKK